MDHLIREENKSTPSVSVIVPIYKVEQYIKRCARSLFEQTLDDIEFLFVDDCTPDNSIEKLERVLEDYPQRKANVIIHRMEHNSGQAAVRKWGILNARGSYIIHCDSDDWIDINMYKTMYEKAEEENADVVICDYMEKSENGNERYFKSCHSTDKDVFLKNLLCQKDAWALWNKLFRRSLYTNDIIFPNYNMAEDMALCIQLILKSEKVAYIPQSFYFYYKRNSSITKLATISNIVANFNSQRNNADIVFNALSQSPNAVWKKWVLPVKLSVISILYPLVHIDKYKTLCFNTYPHLLWKVVFSSRIDLKTKLLFVMAKLQLYPNPLHVDNIQ